jgi:5-methylcytosine-specific restriction endonuclease McrA
LRKNALRRGAVERGDPVQIGALLEAYGHRCGICAEPLGDDVHFDHIVPISRGGHHGMDNVQPTHGTCNRKKFNSLNYERRAS